MGEGKKGSRSHLQASEGSLQTTPPLDSVTILLGGRQAGQTRSQQGRGKIFTGSAFITW
jgi:hypothetical protein